MADRIYDDNPAITAPSFTRKSDGAIPFGKLVMLGTAAGDVKVTTGITVAVFGIAIPNEVIYAKSETAEYADNDVVTVGTLMAGKIYYMYAMGAISEGDFVSAAAAGDVSPITPGAGTSYQVQGIALDDIADDNWGRILVI